jgi:cation transport ATPase
MFCKLMATMHSKCTKEITLPVAGMTCAARVRKVEKALKGHPRRRAGHRQAQRGEGGIVYDLKACDIPKMCESMEGIG